MGAADEHDGWLWPPGKRRVAGLGKGRGRGRGRGGGRAGAAAGAADTAAGDPPADAVAEAHHAEDGSAAGERLDELDAPLEAEPEGDAVEEVDEGLALLLEAQDEIADVVPVGAGGIADLDVHCDGGATPDAGPEAPVFEAEPDLRFAAAEADLPVAGLEAPVPLAAAPEPPLPPPASPPPAPPVREGAVGRGIDTMWAHENGGTIVHYPVLRSFVATCPSPAHGRCILTRKSAFGLDSEKQDRMRGGRPLGVLGAFLAAAMDIDTKDAHFDFDRAVWGLPVRQACREKFKAILAGKSLLAKERQQKATEPEESASIAAYRGRL